MFDVILCLVVSCIISPTSTRRVFLESLCVYQGYRHVSLRNECNQPQGLATLFVHIRVTDYIPDAFAGTHNRTVFEHKKCT